MLKVLIAVPSMDMVSARFAQSLAAIQKPCESAVAFQIGSLIYDARNKLVQQAIKYEADYIMWLDSDMVFPPDTLVRLFEDIREGRDIVTGLYFRRVLPFKPVIYKALGRDVKTEDYEDYPRDEIFEVAGCGFGCVLMKTDVISRVTGRFGKPFTPMIDYGEDLAFCLRAAETGTEIWCDPTARVGHIAHVPVYPEDHKAALAARG